MSVFRTGRVFLDRSHERGTVPEVVEDASESAWAEFDSCWEQLDAKVGTANKSIAAPRGAALRAADRGLADGLV